MNAKQTRAIMRKAQALVGNSIKQKKEEIKREQNKLRAIQDAQLSMTLLFGVLIQKLGGLELNGWFSPIGFGETQKIMAFLYVTANGFKHPDVVRTLEFLTGEFPDVKSKDAEYSLSRCYSFEKPEMKVEFTVYVEGENPTCRRVEIGEETTTRKKYRIVCE